ncbi:hypothetical protein Tco_0120022 [Tanacetum coccineum]
MAGDAVVMGDKRWELKGSIGNEKLDVLSGSMDQRGWYGYSIKRTKTKAKQTKLSTRLKTAWKNESNGVFRFYWASP